MAASSHNAAAVAVIGAGVAGCVAASSLAERGIPVTLFEKARGPGGRVSTRRETASNGDNLLFDHGAQYMTVNYPSMQHLVDKWQAAGLIEVWHAKFGTYNFVDRQFLETQGDGKRKYVGVPGMNSICKFMSLQAGVNAQFNTMVAQLTWKEEGLWLLTGQDGKSLGTFEAVVVADKAFAQVQTGFLASSLEVAGLPDLYKRMACIRSVPCFAVMLAFSNPLHRVPYDYFIIESSGLLAGAIRVSSKPGRTVLPNSEYWVLQSTVEFAKKIISKQGLGKPSSELLNSVAQTLLKEFQEIVPDATTPFHMKAHRWGSAFPIGAAEMEEKCLIDKGKKIVACGDFCVAPRIDGAIMSGLAAADNIHNILRMATAKF